jgi:hypothetical protein
MAETLQYSLAASNDVSQARILKIPHEICSDSGKWNAIPSLSRLGGGGLSGLLPWRPLSTPVGEIRRPRVALGFLC